LQAPGTIRKGGPVTKSLPERPSLEHLKQEAKSLLRSFRSGAPECVAVLRNLSRFSGKSDAEVLASDLVLAEAQYALALEYGFESWDKLRTHTMEKEALPGKQKDSPSVELSPFQKELVLSALLSGSEIASVGRAWYSEDGYPLLIRTRMPDGRERELELAAYTNHRVDSADREAELLPVLTELGLPVPEVVAGPASDPGQPDLGQMIVVSHLPGEFPPFINATAEELDLTCDLILEGTERLRGLTDALLAHPVGRKLPRRTLQSQLDGIIRSGGPWMDQALFQKAIGALAPVLESDDTPLVFSNGSNITWNFRHDGKRVTAYLAFGRACFEDPHTHFAKYKVWESDEVGWKPFNRAGLVERYLYSQDVSKSQFASRIALECLREVQKVTPATTDGGTEFALSLLQDSLASLE